MGKGSKQGVELPVYEMLRRIKEGELNPELLPRETRQLCIEALVGEGYSSGQIASLLNKSDRTIRRDLVELRKRNSISASPELTGMIGGELLNFARNQCCRLKQIARSKDIEAVERAKVELMSWQVFKEGADKLHKLGFLPVASATTVKNSKKDVAAIDQGSVTLPDGQPQPVIDPVLQNKIACLGPMDREKLLEGLRKDMVEIKKEEQKESSSLLG
jgi:transposase